MGPHALLRVVGIVAVLGAAGCGQDATPAGGSTDATTRDERRAPPRARAADVPAVALSAQDVERLFDEWRAVEDDVRARLAVEDRLLAGGGAVLDRLIAWLGEADRAHEHVLIKLLPLFGDAAAARLEVVLCGSDRDARVAAMELLPTLLRSSLDGARGEAICRATFELARSGDEDESARALALLGSIGPSARCVAVEVAQLWCDATWDQRSRAADVLRYLGTDAAPAAPTLAAWLRATSMEAEPATEELQSERADRIEQVFSILQAVSTADPTILADLRAVLAGGPVGLQQRVASLLWRWGDAAAPAAPELIELLRSPDEYLRATAAAVLAGAPTTHDAARAAILAALVATDESRRIRWSWRLGGFLRDSAFAARLAEIAPSLPEESVSEVCEALNWRRIGDPRVLVAALLARPESVFRRTALDVWIARAEAETVPPEEIRALLDDSDARVRIQAAQGLVGRAGVDADRIRDVALGVPADERDVRRLALRVLGALASTDAKAFEAIVAALDDPDLVLTAFDSVPPGESRIPGRHPVAITAVLPQVFDGEHVDRTAPTLLRFEGGADAIVSAVQSRLAAFDSATDQEQYAEIRKLMPVITILGPRAAVVRPALARIYRDLAPGPPGDDNRRSIDRAIAEIDGDLQTIALTAGVADRALVERFLAAGDDGRRALVLYASRDAYSDETFVELFHDARADEAILAAAATSRSTDPFARERRTGAATLAPLLPVERACALLRTLAGDDEADVRSAVVEAWDRLRKTHPSALTAADVAPLLSDTDGAVRREAISLAAALGPRGTDLVPALRAIRDDHANFDLQDSVLALWRITKDPDEAVPAVRAWLMRPSGPRDRWRDPQDRWYFRGSETGLAELPFTSEDVPAIVRAVADQRADLAVFAPLLARFGPDAASAVPVLRSRLHLLPAGDYNMGELMVEEGWVDTEGRAAARVLVAIGPAARAAVADLRWRIAEIGDSAGVLRDAIQKIEASGR